MFCSATDHLHHAWYGNTIDSGDDLSPYTVQCANVVPPLSSWRQFPLIMVMNKLKGSCTRVGVLVVVMLAGGVVQSIAHKAHFTSIDVLSVGCVQIGGLC